MNKRLAACAIALTSLLAACGGGSSGGSGPTVVPTLAPPAPTSYTASLRFVGALAGAQIQGEAWRSEAFPQSGTSTPPPIMVLSAPDSSSGPESSAFGGEVQAVVSPMPTSSPSVAFTQTNTVAVINTPPPPGPGQTPQPLPTGVVSQVFVTSNGAVQAQNTGTATATIGAPVNQTPTSAVYSYMSIALDCFPASVDSILAGSTANHFGWKWTGSTWTPDDNVTTADIYVDGKSPGASASCVAPNPSESDVTVHIPGGDTRLSTDAAFSSVTASQWANTETSFTITQAIATNPDGSNNGFVIGKTRDGLHIFKLFPNAIGSGVGYFGGIEVSGDSVDGF